MRRTHITTTEARPRYAEVEKSESKPIYVHSLTKGEKYNAEAAIFPIPRAHSPIPPPLPIPAPA